MSGALLHLFVAVFLNKGAAALCPQGSTQGAHSYDCYLYQLYPTRRVNAQSQCLAIGGQLASVESAFEAAKVNSLADPSKGSYWFGLSWNEIWEAWRWDDNADLSYTNWDKGQPNTKAQTCVQVNATTRKWSASYCTFGRPYVCKLPPIDLPPVVVTSPSAKQCQEGWTFFAGSDLCYAAFTRLTSWHGAAYHCRSMGGDLVAITNDALNDFVGGHGKDGTAYWIGLYNPRNCQPHDADCNWQWTDGAIASYEHWGAPFPLTLSYDILCGVTIASSFEGLSAWQNYQCLQNYPYICQMPTHASVS